MVVRARALTVAGNDACSLGEGFKAPSVRLTVDREHREDEVGLSQLGPAAVDAQEDLSDELLADLAADPHGVEWVVPQRRQPPEGVAQNALLPVGKRLWTNC